MSEKPDDAIANAVGLLREQARHLRDDVIGTLYDAPNRYAQECLAKAAELKSAADALDRVAQAQAERDAYQRTALHLLDEARESLGCAFCANAITECETCADLGARIDAALAAAPAGGAR